MITIVFRKTLIFILLVTFKNSWMCMYCCTMYHAAKDILKIRCELQNILLLYLKMFNSYGCNIPSCGRGQQIGDYDLLSKSEGFGVGKFSLCFMGEVRRKIRVRMTTFTSYLR